jgi:hypothetical protein
MSFLFCPKSKASSDDCTRAAGIYECGKKNAPGLTDAIQNQLKSDRASPGAVNKP